MQDMELTPEYLKSFNDSYLIAKHLPELSAKLSSVKSDTPALAGMRDGRDQFISEFEKDQYPSWLRDDRLKSMGKHQDKGKEKENPNLLK